MEYSQITQQANQALRELLEVAGLKAGDLFVVGCSSSEVRGEHIGKGSSMERYCLHWNRAAKVPFLPSA